MKKKIDPDHPSFNKLPKATRERHMKDKSKTINPFELPKGHPMVNPVTNEIRGNWKDGIHFLRNPFNYNLVKKIEVASNIVIRSWVIDDTTDEWIEEKIDK